MGLRIKFNLVLLLVAAVGLLLFKLVSTPILQSVGRQEVLQSSRIMMESAGRPASSPWPWQTRPLASPGPFWLAAKSTELPP